MYPYMHLDYWNLEAILLEDRASYGRQGYHRKLEMIQIYTLLLSMYVFDQVDTWFALLRHLLDRENKSFACSSL